jgi:hypothetical protein
MVNTYEIHSKGSKTAVKLCRIVSSKLKKNPRLINGLFLIFTINRSGLFNFENEPIWLI